MVIKEPTTTNKVLALITELPEEVTDRAGAGSGEFVI
jgi:hypothetical protein